MTTGRTARELRWYVAVTYGFSWLLWTPAVLSALNDRSFTLAWFGELGSNNVALASLIAGFGPLIAAGVVTLAARGGAETRQLVGRVFRFRFGIQWYLAALFVSPLAYLGAALLRLVISGSFDFSHGSASGAVLAFATGTAILTPIIVCEELGWLSQVVVFWVLAAVVIRIYGGGNLSRRERFIVG